MKSKGIKGRTRIGLRLRMSSSLRWKRMRIADLGGFEVVAGQANNLLCRCLIRTTVSVRR